MLSHGASCLGVLENVGYSDGTVGWSRGCSMFSQDVLPKPIYQFILSEDYKNGIPPCFQGTGYQNQGLSSICVRIKNHLSCAHPAAAHFKMPEGPRAVRYSTGTALIHMNESYGTIRIKNRRL